MMIQCIQAQNNFLKITTVASHLLSLDVNLLPVTKVIQMQSLLTSQLYIHILCIFIESCQHLGECFAWWTDINKRIIASKVYYHNIIDENMHIPSLSAMKTVAVEGGTTLALTPVTVKATLKVSVPSQRLSSVMGMLQHSWLSVPENTRGLQVMGP